LVEKYTKDKMRFQDNLEIIKFICKEFWTEIFKKQVDNLKTNHKGTYVLNDLKFRWLVKFSSDSNQIAKQTAIKYLVFPCGLIKGALYNLGISADVSAETTVLPACVFTIIIK
jgi:hypothetical protein